MTDKPARASLRLRVSRGGAPAKGARVAIVDGPGSWEDMAMVTDDDGQVGLRLTPGEYAVAIADDVGAARRVITVGQGPTAAVQLDDDAP